MSTGSWARSSRPTPIKPTSSPRPGGIFIYVGEEENPRTVKEQNAWLSERKCLRAELVEVAGKPFKPDNRDAALKAAQALGFELSETIEKEDENAKGPQQHQVKYLGTVAKAPDFKIADIETKRTTSRPSPPFITSTMQQQASTRLGFQLKRTMRVAQQLYEGVDLKGARGQTGLITYMRTDSTHLSKEALSDCRSHVESKLGKKYLPDKPNVYKSSNKDAQEAHEAIRPTDVSLTPASIKRRAQRRAVQALRPDLAPLRRQPDGPRPVGLDRHHDPSPRRR